MFGLKAVYVPMADDFRADVKASQQFVVVNYEIRVVIESLRIALAPPS